MRQYSYSIDYHTTLLSHNCICSATPDYDTITPPLLSNDKVYLAYTYSPSRLFHIRTIYARLWRSSTTFTSVSSQPLPYTASCTYTSLPFPCTNKQHITTHHSICPQHIKQSKIISLYQDKRKTMLALKIAFNKIDIGEKKLSSNSTSNYRISSPLLSHNEKVTYII